MEDLIQALKGIGALAPSVAVTWARADDRDVSICRCSAEFGYDREDPDARHTLYVAREVEPERHGSADIEAVVVADMAAQARAGELFRHVVADLRFQAAAVAELSAERAARAAPLTFPEAPESQAGPSTAANLSSNPQAEVTHGQ